MRLICPQVLFPDLCMRQLTSGYDGQLGSTGHEYRVEVRDGAGGDDVPSNGLDKQTACESQPRKPWLTQLPPEHRTGGLHPLEGDLRTSSPRRCKTAQRETQNNVQNLRPECLEMGSSSEIHWSVNWGQPAPLNLFNFTQPYSERVKVAYPRGHTELVQQN